MSPLSGGPTGSRQGREDAWHSRVERMMADLNAKLEEGIEGNLSAVTLR